MSTSGTDSSLSASDAARKSNKAAFGGLSLIHQHAVKGSQELTASLGQIGSRVTTATKFAARKLEDVTKKTGEAIVKRTHLNTTIKDVSGDSGNIVSPSENDTREVIFHVEPDEILTKMDIILKKRLKGVSVEQFHELIWINGGFYQGWLEASGKDEITVGEWEASEGGFHGEWEDDTTQYTERRDVDFKFTRTTHLYTGPPVAKVTQVHLSKLTEDRCIVQIQIKMEGIPFANCFNVEIRWVATRTTTTEIQIEVGLYVDFVEQTILAGKIRSGTTEETTKTQQSLLKAVVEECSKYAKNAGTAMEVDDGNDVTTVGAVRDSGALDGNPCLAFPKMIADLFKDRRSDPLGQKAQSVECMLRRIIDSLDVASDLDPQVEAKIDSELTDIREALITIQRLLNMAHMRKAKSSRDLFK